MTPVLPRWLRPCAAALAMGLALAVLVPSAQARCVDEEGADVPPGSAYAPSFDASLPRLTLQGMVKEAIRRSQAIGAAKLLAEAAQSDVKEIKAGALPQANLSGTIGGAGNGAPGVPNTNGGTVRASVNVTAPLYDGGRLEELTGWRKHLAESARLGEINAEEQVALQTVSLALERARYRLQVQVYQQYARKMGCLVEALEQIVAADKGRTSELVQARKNLQQAELSQTQTTSTVRQIETKLRRFVGDGLPSTEGLSAVLLQVPPLDQLQAEAERSAEIAQLGAQAAALNSYARSVAAGQKPQLNWVVSGSKAAGVGGSTSLMAGVNYNIPLYNPSLVHTADAASKRAEAARLQRADAIEGLRAHMAEVHEQASSGFDRARQVVQILRNSNLVRNYTLQQWQQMGRRSLFDVMGAESDHYGLRVAYVNAIFDAEQSNALLRSLGLGIATWLE